MTDGDFLRLSLGEEKVLVAVNFSYDMGFSRSMVLIYFDLFGVLKVCPLGDTIERYSVSSSLLLCLGVPVTVFKSSLV